MFCFTSVSDQGIEGRDFFSKYALFDAFLQLNEGKGNELPGLSRDDASLLVPKLFFGAAAYQQLAPSFEITMQGSSDDWINV